MTTLAGIAGSLQANEVIKSILNIGKNSHGNIMIFNALDSKFRKIKLLRNANCKRNCIYA
jgi:adenylyltransferase/sulfurtransferase